MAIINENNQSNQPVVEFDPDLQRQLMADLGLAPASDSAAGAYPGGNMSNFPTAITGPGAFLPIPPAAGTVNPAGEPSAGLRDLIDTTNATRALNMERWDRETPGWDDPNRQAAPVKETKYLKAGRVPLPDGGYANIPVGGAFTVDDAMRFAQGLGDAPRGFGYIRRTDDEAAKPLSEEEYQKRLKPYLTDAADPKALAQAFASNDQFRDAAGRQTVQASERRAALQRMNEERQREETQRRQDRSALMNILNQNKYDREKYLQEAGSRANQLLMNSRPGLAGGLDPRAAAQTIGQIYGSAPQRFDPTGALIGLTNVQSRERLGQQGIRGDAQQTQAIARAQEAKALSDLEQARIGAETDLNKEMLDVYAPVLREEAQVPNRMMMEDLRAKRDLYDAMRSIGTREMTPQQLEQALTQYAGTPEDAAVLLRQARDQGLIGDVSHRMNPFRGRGAQVNVDALRSLAGDVETAAAPSTVTDAMRARFGDAVLPIDFRKNTEAANIAREYEQAAKDPRVQANWDKMNADNLLADKKIAAEFRNEDALRNYLWLLAKNGASSEKAAREAIQQMIEANHAQMRRR